MPATLPPALTPEGGPLRTNDLDAVLVALGLIFLVAAALLVLSQHLEAWVTRDGPDRADRRRRPRSQVVTNTVHAALEAARSLRRRLSR